MRQNTFFRAKAEQFIENLFFVKLLQKEMARGYIDPADRRRSGTEIDGAEKVIFLLIQQHIIGERSGGYYPNNISFYYTLCGLWILYLFADGDFETGLEHFFEVAVNGVVRQAGKRDGVGPFTPAGKGEAKNARAGLSILVKGLVKIAHPKKQHRIRVLFLEMMKLLHRRR